MRLFNIIIKEQSIIRVKLIHHDLSAVQERLKNMGDTLIIARHARDKESQIIIDFPMDVTHTKEFAMTITALAVFERIGKGVF